MKRNEKQLIYDYYLAKTKGDFIWAGMIKQELKERFNYIPGHGSECRGDIFDMLNNVVNEGH